MLQNDLWNGSREKAEPFFCACLSVVQPNLRTEVCLLHQIQAQQKSKIFNNGPKDKWVNKASSERLIKSVYFEGWSAAKIISPKEKGSFRAILYFEMLVICSIFEDDQRMSSIDFSSCNHSGASNWFQVLNQLMQWKRCDWLIYWHGGKPIWNYAL